MSTSSLEDISNKIVKAMHLPEFFTKPLPLSDILDTPIRLSRIIRQTKARKIKAKSENAKKEATAHSASSLVTLSGKISDGKQTRFSIAGQDFQVQATTWIIGDVKMGGVARVKGIINSSDVLEATSVVLLEQS